jgi:hypothetical protein
MFVKSTNRGDAPVEIQTERRLPTPTMVKFTLEYATKTYGESTGIALLFL